MPAPQQPAPVRAFVAACLSPDLLNGLQRVQQQLQKRLRIQPGPVRWTLPGQIHLTLRFFGNIQASEIESLASVLRQATHGTAPLDLSVAGLGCFPSWRRPSVIWVGVHGELEPLLALQARMERESRAFGSHSEKRAFHPHLTIGRVRSEAAGTGQLGAAFSEEDVQLGAWRLEEIALLQSQLTPRGSVYTPLANFKLQSP